VLNALLVIVITAALMGAAYLFVRYPIVLGLYMAGIVAAAFLLPPIEGLVGTPIVFFHVPVSRVCAIGFMLGAWFGGLYLWKRRPDDDIKSAAAVEVGFLFALISTATGSFFSYLNWSEFWSWDPRQTASFFLLLIYGAYLALRASLEGGDTRAQLSSVYSILAFFSAIFLIFVYPHLFKTLHPPVRMKMDPQYQGLLYAAMLGYAGLWIWLFRATIAITKMEAIARINALESALKE
jgi:heme exporter protein C